MGTSVTPLDAWSSVWWLIRNIWNQYLSDEDFWLLNYLGSGYFASHDFLRQQIQKLRELIARLLTQRTFPLARPQDPANY